MKPTLSVIKVDIGGFGGGRPGKLLKLPIPMPDLIEKTNGFRNRSDTRRERSMSRSRNSQRSVTSIGGASNNSVGGTKDGGGGSSDNGGSDEGGDRDDDPANYGVLVLFIVSIKETDNNPIKIKDLILETFLKEVIKLPFGVVMGIMTGIIVAILLALLGIKL